MPDSTYICPGCNEPLPITGVRQRRTLAKGGTVYHSRDCQIAASQETRPCSATGCPNMITRRKSGFSGDTAVCSPSCRGALKRTKRTYECALPACKVTVERTPASVHGDVYCSRRCFGLGTRTAERSTVTCGGCGGTFEVTAQRAGRAEQLFCSQECRKTAARVDLPCTGCGRAVWRYRSQFPSMADGQAPRVFCGECRDSGVGFKPRKGTTKPCANCGEPVYRRPSEADDGARYCGIPCKAGAMRGEEHVPRTERPCAVCGNIMRLTPEKVREDVQTCSRECADASKRRKPGERYVDKRNGYVVITSPDGRSMMEHRYVMEQVIGRPMLPSETAHHLTGGFAGRSDNSPGNLELWTGRHPSGHRIEDVIAYCREMLAVYGDHGEQARYIQYRAAVLSDTSAAALEEGDSMTEIGSTDEEALREAGYRPIGELLDQACAIISEAAAAGEVDLSAVRQVLAEHDGPAA